MKTSKIRRLRFDHAPERYRFVWDSAMDRRIAELKRRYDLGRLEDREGNRYRTLKNCLKWAHGRFCLSDYNSSLSPLEGAAPAKRLRCVEYSAILRACLAALGIRARRLALKTRDAETRKEGAGHIAVEAYVPEYGKWVFIDPQWGTLPVLDGTPLNAVELQAVISEGRDVKFWNLKAVEGKRYRDYIYRYLFYFDVRFDNRTRMDRKRHERLMLVPIGAKRPKVFQRTLPLRNTRYTNSLKAFYPAVKPGK
jgi:transglutaminase-like putative cysteine protease